MQGRVLETAPKPKAKAKSKAKGKPPKETKAKAKSAKGRGKSGSAGSAGAGDDDARNAPPTTAADLLPEPTKLDDNVMVEVDGQSASRTKYFVDCMLGGIRTALLSARQTLGAPIGSKPAQPDSDTATSGTTIHYYDHEVPILRQCIHIGVTFALQQSVEIDGKTHKRWSTCRPAMQFYAFKLVRHAL